MFSPGSSEKSSLSLADSTPPGCSKFGIGINSLADENQQNIRVQLAVHRYSSPNGRHFIRPVNERNIPSPFKQDFIKSSPKFKSFENDKEDNQNSMKKSHNQYQGVGNFPVVYLKKNSVLTKPVRRSVSNDFKIQLPELPFNRFLNHTPEACLDTKTSTRSVLDVLQDLSRKRIHTKDDTEASKRKCKGLGGDAPLNIEAPYKPLFVPKTRNNGVTFRDSTTQTQDIPVLDSQSKKSESALTNDQNDPKAELRRKLARQNNEIFASLSSSTLSYPIKRNREKMSQGKNDKTDEFRAKKSKYFTDENGDKLANGSSVNNLPLSGSGDHTNKVEKKQKVSDGNKISPSKDRLTAIFMEMKDVNPKLEVLTKNQEKDGKSISESTPKAVDVDKSINGSLSDIVTSGNNSQNFDSTKTTVNTSATKDATDIASNSSFNSKKISDNKMSGTNISILSKENVLPTSEESKNTSTAISATTTASFILPTTTTINFGFKAASTVSSSVTETPILSTGISQKPFGTSFTTSTECKTTNAITESPKNENSSQNNTIHVIPVIEQPAANSESAQGTDKPSAVGSLFKFGTGDGIQTQSVSQEQKLNSDTVPKTAFGPGFFTFGSTNTNSSNSATSAIQTEPKESSEINLNQTNSAIKSPPMGLSSGAPSSQPLLIGFPSSVSTSSTPSTVTSITTCTTQSQPSIPAFTFSDKTSENQTAQKAPTFSFGFGQMANNNSSTLFKASSNEITKPEEKATAEDKSQNKSDTQQEKSNSVTMTSSTFTQNPFGSTPFSAATSFGQTGSSSTPSLQNTAQPFKFGDKTDVPKSESLFTFNSPSTSISSNSSSAASIFNQKPKSGIFTFGQTTQETPASTASQPAVSQPNMFQSNVFTFGQKPADPAPQSSENTSIFGQKSVSKPSLFQQPGTSQTTATSGSVLSAASPFGITTTANSTGIMNNTFNQNKVSMPTFGQTVPSFGQASSTPTFSAETNIFASNSIQNTPAFGNSTPAQPSPFSHTFGDSANKQQNIAGQSSNFFMQPTASQSSGFSQNTGFSGSAFGQSTTNNNNSNNNNNNNNVFGQKSMTQIGGFEQSQNQASPFGQSSSAQNFPSQTAPFTFGAPAATSASSGFTLSATTSAPVFSFGASTFKFGSTPAKETPSFGAGSSTGGFSFMPTPSTSEAAKPAPPVFNFSSAQNTPSNSGFNFGGSSSSSNTSTFSFTATQPNAGMFTPGATPSPSVPLQGKFSIGAGPSQPRNRSIGQRARRRT